MKNEITLTTNISASSYGIPVLVIYGQAYAAGENIKEILKEEDKSPFDFLADRITAADWVFDNLVIEEPLRGNNGRAGAPIKENQDISVQLFLNDCEDCTTPGAGWRRA